MSTIYLFDRDGVGQWGFTAMPADRTGAGYEANGFDSLAEAVAAAEDYAAHRGEDFDQPIALTLRPENAR